MYCALGCKVGIAVTNREGLFVAASAFKGNPYDGHTLQATIDQAEAMSGAAVERAYVDKSYRGHDYEDPPCQDYPLRAKSWSHAPNKTRAHATIYHRADDRTRQERRQAQ